MHKKHCDHTVKARNIPHRLVFVSYLFDYSEIVHVYEISVYICSVNEPYLWLFTKK